MISFTSFQLDFILLITCSTSPGEVKDNLKTLVSMHVYLSQLCHIFDITHAKRSQVVF